MAGPLDAGCRLFGARFIDGRRVPIAAKKSNGRPHFLHRKGAQNFFRRPFMGGIGAVQGLSIIEDGFIEEFRFGAGCAPSGFHHRNDSRRQSGRRWQK